MLCIFDGRPSQNIDAGDVRLAIISQVAIPEASETRQERQDGAFTLVLVGGNAVSEIVDTGPRIVRFSTSLAGLVNLNDFPAGHAFGNGVTLASVVPLTDGPRLLSWCVFPDSAVAQVNANFAALQALMEN